MLWVLVIVVLVHQQVTRADDAGVCCDCFASENDGGVCSVSVSYSSSVNCCCGSVAYGLNGGGFCDGDSAHSLCKLCPSSLPSLPCCDCPAAASSQDVGGICSGGDYQDCCCTDLIHYDSIGTAVCPSSTACKTVTARRQLQSQTFKATLLLRLQTFLAIRL